MFPPLPTGSTWRSGASPRASTISKAAVFWPSIRTGLTELTSATGIALGQRAGQPQAVVEVAFDLDHLGAVHDRLGELARRDPAGRQQHDGFSPPRDGVRRGRSRGVAGGGADHRLGTLAGGDADGDGHAAVLEGPGRVGALDLQPDLAAELARTAPAPGPAACRPRPA